MKTEIEIRKDIKFYKEEKTKAGKTKLNTKKIKRLSHLITVSQNLSEEKIEFERQKLIKELDKKDELFERFLANFTTFQRFEETDQRRDVRKIFDGEFKIKAIKDKIKDLNYLLNKH